MKKFLVIALLMCGMCAQALVIEGGVHYTVESARDEAFSKVQYTIPMIDHFEYLVDPGFSIGKDGKPKIRKFGRIVTFFSDGSYGVSVKKGNFNYYYYNSNGQLEAIELSDGGNYPRLTQKYDINGKLIIICYRVSKSEVFVFGSDKSYHGHWIKDILYGPDGNIKDYRY